MKNSLKTYQLSLQVTFYFVIKRKKNKKKSKGVRNISGSFAIHVRAIQTCALLAAPFLVLAGNHCLTAFGISGFLVQSNSDHKDASSLSF